MSEEASEITPTPTVEQPMDTVTMQGLGITHQDIKNYWERQNSAVNEAFQEGSRTYNMLRGSDGSVTAVKLNDWDLITLDAPAHNPDDYVRSVADLLQRREYQDKSELIKTNLQGFALEAPKDKNYRLMAKVINLTVDGDLVRDTKLSGKIKEKFAAVFGHDATVELAALGYEIDRAREVHPTPTPDVPPGVRMPREPTQTPSPSPQDTKEQTLRPVTPNNLPQPSSSFGRND